MIHARKTVHETLDGETIVIHLESGSYYSLTGSGAEIWTLLSVSRSLEEIVAAMAQRHDLDERTIRTEVQAFLADLEREQLIEDGELTGRELTPPGDGDFVGWTTPKLERYDDMKNFLLVDPIHEVDDAGWPHRRPE